MTFRFLAGAGLTVALLAACGRGPELPPAEQLTDAVRQAVEQADGRREAARSALEGFYTERDFKLAWVPAGRSSGNTRRLLDAIDQAQTHGLDPQRYGQPALAREVDELDATHAPDAQTLAALDTRLSLAYLDLAIDLDQGQIDPGSADKRWPTRDGKVDYGASLREGLNGDVAEQLNALAPDQPAYARLLEQRRRYANIAENGGWETVPAGETLTEGDRSPRVEPLRQRLASTGDLDAAAAPDATLFDAAVIQALRRFQQRHGLEEDAVLGPSTLEALNVTADERLRHIDANLERWRWLPADLGARHIIVNIPEYHVHAFDGGRPALDMKVIVGKTYEDRETPVFTDEMQEVVFRPLWGIPQSIAVEEILPKAREDLGYLAEKQYQIAADYSPDAKVFKPTPENLDRVEAGELRMRQLGGRHNSLGLVKFLFPNQFAVYLHDTPADHLFEKRERSFSHGCIRLERPADMAGFVLSGQPGWDETAIDEAMHAGDRQSVNLDQSLPVYILYWTAFVHEDGVMQFREDIYGHDEPLLLAMQQSGE